MMTFEEDLQEKYCDSCGSTSHNQSEHKTTRYEDSKIDERVLETLSKRELINEIMKKRNEQLCGNERPKRDVLCQREKDHNGRHYAVIYWED
jgi:hypothetical protein